MGLISPGGVHSHQDHAVDLARALTDAGVKVAVHVFTDGTLLHGSAVGVLGRVEGRAAQTPRPLVSVASATPRWATRSGASNPTLRGLALSIAPGYLPCPSRPTLIAVTTSPSSGIG